MGQETSSLAQQSINVSAGASRVTSTQEMQTPNATHGNTDHRYTGSMQRGRSRSPGNRRIDDYPLPPKQHAQSSNTRGPRSPPTSRFSSPGSTRHRFVRENVEERRMSDDRYMPQRSSLRSPNARFGLRDDDVRQRSPVSRRISDNHTSWARNMGSPETPREPAAYRADSYSSDRTRSIGGKIDFHGLRGVPTGPRGSTSGRGSISGMVAPERDHSTRSPCIFISLQYLPQDSTVIKHLNGLLKNLKPMETVIDDFGWNLIYDDSPAGAKRLKQCYERFHRKKLFNMYELFMECFANGKPPRPQRDMDTNSSCGPDGSIALRPSHQNPNNTASPSFGARQITYPDPIRSPETGTSIVPSTSRETNVLAHTANHELPRDLSRRSSEALRAHDHAPAALNASQLSLRTDRDETGSLASGVTRSDSSRGKQKKCHRCKGDDPPGSSPLVRCSTCPRQYHNRCHQDPVIPAHLNEGHTWSCTPCVKKGRSEKQIPNRDSSKPLSTLGQSALTTDSPLGCFVDKGQGKQSNSHTPIAKEVDDENNAQTEALRSDSKSPQHEGEPRGDAISTTKLSAVQGEHLFSDAEDLVAKSFAAAEDQSLSKTRPQKPSKLKFTRTKLPPKIPNTAPQQPQSEITLDQATSFPSNQSTQASKYVTPEEGVTRNSVADLRALAHERHQTATKGGTEGHFVSEEQRLRHIASSSESAQSSSAHQTSNRGRLPEHPEKSTLGSIAPTISKRTAEREIPESPDEVRRGVSSSEAMTSDPRSLARLNSVVTQPQAENKSDARSTQIDKPPTLKGPRGPSAVDRCSMCGKRIPQGPSRTNKLCSGCKKIVAATKGAEDVAADNRAPQTVFTPVRTPFAPVANMVAGPQKVANRPDLGAHGLETAVVDQQMGAAPQTSDKIAQADDNPVGLPVNAGSSADPTPKTTNSNESSDKNEQRALSPSPKGKDVLANPLAARILGELQFSPTVQTQLREDPSMSEFKIHLLKRVLVENETARTDEKVLADQLERALTNIRNSPVPPKQADAYPGPTALESADVDSSQSRLNFIKSVVGDSSERPKGSRLILVAMALGSSAARRMQAKDVMDWIANTVPTYTRGEGNWASRISAQLSQGRLTDSGNGYWREEDWQQGDGGKPNSRWYQLLPEKEDEMWTWCPVLKEPLSPQSRRDAKTRKATESRSVKPVQHTPAQLQAPTAASTSAPVTPLSNNNNSVSIYCGSYVAGDDGKRIHTNDAETTEDDPIEIDEFMAEDAAQSVHGQKRKQRSALGSKDLDTPAKKDSSSDDDEPLSARAKRMRRETLSQDRFTNLRTVQQNTPADIDVDNQLGSKPDTTAVGPATRRDGTEGFAGNANKASDTTAGPKKSGLVTLKLRGRDKSFIPTASNRHFLANRESLAKSLYDEWPEYRPQAFDEDEKLAEIRARPKKKQMFGRPALYASLHPQKTLFDQNSLPSNTSLEKRSRTMVDPTPDEPYPWENPDHDPTRKEYDSLEALFDFPNNMIPIISEGQLAFRDGTRTEDGRLPRAREIFKP